MLPWLTGAGFVVLAVALFWVWRHPAAPAQSPRLADLAARVAALEQRSAPPAANLAPLAARITALEQRPAAQQAAPPDLARWPPRGRPGASAAAAARPRRAPPWRHASRLSNTAIMPTRRGLAGLEQSIGRAARCRRRAWRSTPGESCPIPGAPPALARYADTPPPPTEAALRLSFPGGSGLTMLFIGLAAGALIALLLAPQTGRQMRKSLRRKYEDARDAVEDFNDQASDWIDKGSEWAEKAKSKVAPLAKPFQR